MSTLLLAAATAALAAVTVAALDVAVLDSMLRHDAYPPLPAAQATTPPLQGEVQAHIAAAGRERESVQVLVRSPANATTRVELLQPMSLPTGSLRLQQAVKSDGGDAGLPWPLRHATARPPTTARTLNVRTLGAKADNATDNSHVFTSALRTLREAGGGTLLVPAGGVYLTLPLNLSSGTVLRVEHGATLKALCDSSRWPTIRTLPSYGSFHSSSTGWFAPFVGAFGVHDIILEGGGVVDGSGECFWGPRSATTMAMKQHGPARGNLLLFEHVQRATLTGLRFVNSPFWTLHLWDSEDVHVDGISVHNPASSDNAALFFGPNTDGIDIDSSNRVLLENSNFHAGDDCVRGKAYTHVYALECLR